METYGSMVIAAMGSALVCFLVAFVVYWIEHHFIDDDRPPIIPACTLDRILNDHTEAFRINQQLNEDKADRLGLLFEVDDGTGEVKYFDTLKEASATLPDIIQPLTIMWKEDARMNTFYKLRRRRYYHYCDMFANKRKRYETVGGVLRTVIRCWVHSSDDTGYYVGDKFLRVTLHQSRMGKPTTETKYINLDDINIYSLGEPYIEDKEDV